MVYQLFVQQVSTNLFCLKNANSSYFVTNTIYNMHIITFLGQND